MNNIQTTSENSSGKSERDSESWQPATLHNANGSSPFLLVCEHASNHFPAAFGTLGIPAELFNNHIAIDIGAEALAHKISEQLDAKLVSCNFSRLLYDCNRPPESDTAVPKISEHFSIPGNHDLSEAERQRRVDELYRPFETTVADAVKSYKNKPILVTIHSFTPVYMGNQRSVEMGVLHDNNTLLADEILRAAESQKLPLKVMRNQPYAAVDGVTHTLKLHGQQNGLLNVMLEIRNDLLATEAQQQQMAETIAGLLTAANTTISASSDATAAATTAGDQV